jgi:DNA primase
VARIPEETIEQILAATDIVDLVGSYFPLKRAGANFKALCPFHNEKTPSFMVNPARQSFHCFGCGEGGSAIGFVMSYENLPFVDAVRKLADRAGITIVEKYDPDAERKRRLRGRLLDLHRETAAFLHELLVSHPDAEHAREYLKGRGLDLSTAENWGIGWMPGNPRIFLDWARNREFSGRELVGSGIASLREPTRAAAGLYLRFRDRLMFPIRIDYGDTIAFSGRQLREDPNSGKYINSPETRLFEKSKVLFALDRARRSMIREKQALLCEGQLDVIACHEHGIEHAVAPLGTAFTPHHAHLLHRYTSKVTLCFDADDAGFKAAERCFAELATQNIEVVVASMPAGDDPDSMLRRDGPEAFRAVLDAAVPFFDFKLDRMATQNRLATPTDRASAARDLAPLLAGLHDPVTLDTTINSVATRLRIGPAEMRAIVETAAQNQHKQQRRPRNANAPAKPAATPPAPLDPTVGYLCHLAMESPEAKEWLSEQFETLHEVREFIEGVPLLQQILARQFDAGSPPAMLAVLETLGPPERRALEADTTFFDGPVPAPLDAAQTALARVSAKALFRRDERIKAELQRGDLPKEQMLALFEEAREVRELLRGVGQRFVCDDRPVNRPKPEKDWKAKKSRKRP